MPIVAATLVAASSTGMPAAISAPNASSIRISVTGQADPLGRGEVVTDAVVDARVDRQVAGLADLEVRVRPPGRRSVTSWSAAASSWSRASCTEIEQRRAVRVRLGLRDLARPRRRHAWRGAELLGGRGRGSTESSEAPLARA